MEAKEGRKVRKKEAREGWKLGKEGRKLGKEGKKEGRNLGS